MMKAQLTMALAALALTLSVPALADRDRGYHHGHHRQHYRHAYDRRAWQVPRHDARSYRQPIPKHHSAQRYSRGSDRYIIHHYHRYDDDYLKWLGGIYLLNEIVPYDHHHHRR